MIHSQYLDGYKKHFYDRLAEGKRPQAVSGWVRRQIYGNARNWYARYSKSLKKSLVRIGWVPCKSIRNGLAYEPPKPS